MNGRLLSAEADRHALEHFSEIINSLTEEDIGFELRALMGNACSDFVVCFAQWGIDLRARIID